MFLTDKHTLYVRCCGVSEEQLDYYFTKNINKIINCENISDIFKHRINFITDKFNKSCGVAYVFLLNSDVYKIFLGIKDEPRIKRAISVLNLDNKINENLSIKILPACVSNITNNILKCKNVPSWVTVNDMKKDFRPFVTNKNLKYKKKHGKYFSEELYPDVNIDTNKTLTITFSPQSTDCQFALHMMKKIKYSLKCPNEPVKTTMLYFKI
jgi:hypothetical protein